MAEQIINVGTAPNNGTGDPLRTAFIKTDNNFDQIWAAGPVGSNVRIQNNVISTLQVNQDLALSPNGTGNVKLNNNTIPGANNVWYLGSTSNRWRGLYVGNVVAGNISIAGSLVVPGDVTIGGNLTVEGDTIQIGNIVTDTKTIQLANTAQTGAAANGSGVTVGANDNIATFLYNSGTNSWVTNLQVTYANGQPIGKLPGGSNTQIQFNDGGDFGGNSTFTFDKTTGNVTIDGLVIGNQTISGTVANANIVLHPNGSGNVVIQGSSQALLHVVGDTADTVNRVRIENFGSNANIGGGEFQGRWTRGTIASPQPTQQDDKLAQFGGQGYAQTGYAFGSKGWISIDAAANWTDTSQPTHISFWTTGSGTTVPVEHLRLGPAGNLVLYGGNLIVGNGYLVTNAIDVSGNITANYFLGNVQGLVGSITNLDSLNFSVENISALVGNNGVNIGAGGFNNLVVLPTDVVIQNVPLSVAANIIGVTADNDGRIEWVGNSSGDGGGYTTLTLTPDDTVNSQVLVLDPTAPGHIHLRAPGIGGNAEQPAANIFLGAENTNFEITAQYVDAAEARIHSAGNTWTFSNNGDLTVPNYVQFAGNTFIGDEPGSGSPAFRIVAPLNYGATIETDSDISGNNWSWTFGADGNLTLPTNRSIIVDGGDGVIGPVSDDMVISWDNEEIRLVSVQGSIEMQADNAFRVQTNYNSGTSTYTSRWEFNQDEIVNITGPSSIVTEAGNLNLQGGRDTLSSGNVTVTAVNNGVSVNTWTFDNSGNLTAPGNISATGNITANYFIGNGSQLTGLPPGYTDSDVATFLAAYGSNTISTTGNVTAGNFIGAGSNVELIAQSEQWVFDTTGNLTLPTGGYLLVQTGIIGAGASPAPTLSGFSSIATTGVQGNISASGNLLAAGYANITGNVNGSGATFSGNVTAGNFIGNGSQLTAVNAVTVDVTNTNGLATTYYPTFVENRTTAQIARADVDLSYRTDTNTLTVGNISSGGNITAAYFVGNGSALTGVTVNTVGNITGTSSNVDIIAGAYQWTFNNTGNLVLPGNTFTVNYANGTAVSLGGGGGTPGGADTNIQFNDSGSFNGTAGLTFNKTSNALVSTGNVTGANVLTSGNGSFILNNSNGRIRQTGSNATISLGDSITLTPDTASSPLNGVIIGGLGYLLAPDSSRNAVLNYGGNSGVMGINTINIYGATATAIVNGGSSGVGNIGGNTTNRFNTAFLTSVDASGNVTAGNLITTGNVSGNVNGFAIGYRDIPVLSLAANTTVSTSDAGKQYYSTSASALTLTIANNASQGFQLGATINIVNQGAGNVSVLRGVGVTMYLAGNSTSSDRTLTSYGVASVTKVATDTWFISGVGLI